MINAALKTISEAVRLARTGLNNPNRPVGSFLFVGSSGTGKTELAKALSEFHFHDESSLIRFDMSEFMEEHSVSKSRRFWRWLPERGSAWNSEHESRSTPSSG